jgi:hypothetical protein
MYSNHLFFYAASCCYNVSLGFIGELNRVILTKGILRSYLFIRILFVACQRNNVSIFLSTVPQAAWSPDTILVSYVPACMPDWDS